MSATTTVTDELVIVREIRPEQDIVRVEFRDGRVASWPIRDGTPDSWMRLCQGSQQRQHPVGVRLAPDGTILAVRRAAHDVVKDIRDDEAGLKRLLFQGHSGVYRLRINGENTAALLQRLERSQRQQTPVWFTAELADLHIVAVAEAEAAGRNGADGA